MHKIWSVLLLPSLLFAATPELQMGKFVLPEFDPEGAMVRRLTADSATGPMDAPLLGQGVLEFFGQRSGVSEAIARLDFTGASYERASGMIRGAGGVRFASPQGAVSGTGFSYEMKTGELRLESEVAVDLPQGKISAGKAVVWLDPVPDAAGNIAIKRGELSGGIVVTELKDKKLGMDRIEADQANYGAEDGLLRVRAPVNFWRGVEQGRLESKSVEVRLGPVLLPTDNVKAAPETSVKNEETP